MFELNKSNQKSNQSKFSIDSDQAVLCVFVRQDEERRRLSDHLQHQRRRPGNVHLHRPIRDRAEVGLGPAHCARYSDAAANSVLTVCYCTRHATAWRCWTEKKSLKATRKQTQGYYEV